MKYCRVFETESNYTDFVNGSDYVTPNLCVIRSTGGTKCKPYIPPPVLAGDVAYWDGSKVKTTPLSSWNTSLGTPVGVVVVPTGFAPDGKARIVSLYGVDKNGNQSNSYVSMYWGSFGTDTSLINYTKVPTTDNNGSTSTGSNGIGYLPSDKFTGATSYVDSKAKYDTTANLIPSPYLGEAPNPDYYKTISGNNTFSDFNGLSNTQTLISLGSDYVAPNAAWKYKDRASSLQWYLPAMGELGYLMPRFNVINNTLTTLGGLAVASNFYFWSSSEYNSGSAYNLNTYIGRIAGYIKDEASYVRPFAILDNGEDSVNLITFTVNGAEYQAEEGMTWGEWVDSEYNSKLGEKERFRVNDKQYNRIQSVFWGYDVIDAYGEYVISTSIINSHNYTFKADTGGGGDA